VGIFTSAAVKLFRALNYSDESAECLLLCRSLISALVAMLITIATVSPILCIPTLYWVLAGLCVGCARLMEPSLASPKETIFDSRSSTVLRENLPGKVFF